MTEPTRERLLRFSQGRPRLAEALAMNAAQVAALLQVGFTLFQQGQMEKASRLLTGLALLEPANVYVHGLLGAVRQRAGDLPAAIAHYTRALELFPRDIASLTNRGEIYLRLGRFREASADLRGAIALDPIGENASANRARLLVTLAAEGLATAGAKGVDAVTEVKWQAARRMARANPGEA